MTTNRQADERPQAPNSERVKHENTMKVFDEHNRFIGYRLGTDSMLYPTEADLVAGTNGRPYTAWEARQTERSRSQRMASDGYLAVLDSRHEYLGVKLSDEDMIYRTIDDLAAGRNGTPYTRKSDHKVHHGPNMAARRAQQPARPVGAAHGVSRTAQPARPATPAPRPKTALEVIQERTSALRAAEPGLSEPQAMTRVIESDQALYAQYVTEQRNK